MGVSIGQKILRKLKLSLCPSLVSAALLVGLCEASLGQGDADLEAPGLPAFAATLASGATLFQNVRIFDGKSATLSAPSNVLVKDNTIARISVSPIPLEANANVQLVLHELITLLVRKKIITENEAVGFLRQMFR